MVWFWVALVATIILVPSLIIGIKWLRFQELAKRHFFSKVTRQHLHIYQGGQLSEAEVEQTRLRYLRWFRRGQRDRVAESLKPGMEYVVKVRALAEIGSDEACEILEKELNRKHTSDKLEQACYWIDLAHGLRMASSESSLPALLNRVAVADNFPLVHFYAAQMVWFNQFIGYLRAFPEKQGVAAVRVLYRAFEGFRAGVDPRLIAEAQLGGMVEAVWDSRGEKPHPILCRLLIEVRRHLRRSEDHAANHFDDAFEKEAYQLQISRLAALDGHFEQYLAETREYLPELLSVAHPDDIQDWLHVVRELRAEGGAKLLQWAKRVPVHVDPNLVLMALAWSRDPAASLFLQETVARCVAEFKHFRRWWPGHAPMESELVMTALAALRHHPSEQTERVLLSASRSKFPEIRAAAISSLGWWEPCLHGAVMMTLHDARMAVRAEARRAARGALARLGELSALAWYRRALESDNSQVVLEVIQAISEEGLTLLWPELDKLVDHEDTQLAACAVEALEQMQEDHDYRFHRKL